MLGGVLTYVRILAVEIVSRPQSLVVPIVSDLMHEQQTERGTTAVHLSPKADIYMFLNGIS